jgi:hypothetical protein
MKPLVVSILLSAAAAQGAEDPKPPVPVRVGTSHRVDVIAPGERVETAIDRMRRATNPTKAIERPAERPAVRGPTATERVQQPSDAQRQAAPPQQQAPAPGGGPGPPHR